MPPYGHALPRNVVPYSRCVEVHVASPAGGLASNGCSVRCSHVAVSRGCITWLYLGTGLRMPREHSAFLGISPFAVASHVLLLHSLGPCDSCVPAKAPVLPQAPLGTALRTCVASLLPSQRGKPSGRRASLPGARVLHQGTSCSGELLWVSGIVCTRD